MPSPRETNSGRAQPTFASAYANTWAQAPHVSVSVPAHVQGTLVPAAAPQPQQQQFQYGPPAQAGFVYTANTVEPWVPATHHDEFYKLVLPMGLLGRVYQVHINPPEKDGPNTSAAKLTFFDLGGAHAFYGSWCESWSSRSTSREEALEEEWRRLQIAYPASNGTRWQVKVTRYRWPVTEDVTRGEGGPKHSRVLVFVGLQAKVNRTWLTTLFDQECKSWEVEHWGDEEDSGEIVENGDETNMKKAAVRRMVVRFGSYRNQAQNIWKFFRAGTDTWRDRNMKEGLACGFGWDPCCVVNRNHDWEWEKGGVEWANREWEGVDLLKVQPRPVHAAEPTNSSSDNSDCELDARDSDAGPAARDTGPAAHDSGPIAETAANDSQERSTELRKATPTAPPALIAPVSASALAELRARYAYLDAEANQEAMAIRQCRSFAEVVLRHRQKVAA
ncbi:hypothetical protein B0T21DRAFT_407930 [Apiosordaria backusii]|uniref:Uncharacterized protein n=1 Tax=Apiosordaria backusii TaxID=314023 RepID=A0AA40K3U6_9PEZI|nr:hypothetical protein B0T21DRAFT_407930 [Apiosordaria backusii]